MQPSKIPGLLSRQVLLGLALLVATATPQPNQLRWHPVADGVLTATFVSTWVASEALKPVLSPPACRWCTTTGLDVAVRRAFNPTLAPSVSGFKPVSTVSDLLAFVFLPMAMVGLDVGLGRRDGMSWPELAVDVLLITEASFIAANMTQVTKYLVARTRPYAIDSGDLTLSDPPDSRLSHFSGHSSFTFALATSTATILTMRGYRQAWVAWVVGLPLATTVAILRMAADKHWFSDVLVGAAVGSLAGVLIPWVFHRPLQVGPVQARLTGTGLLATW